jgi:hypothetical protein
MSEKEHLLGQLDSARAAFLRVVAPIDPTIEIYPGWTTRQLYAHVSGWDETVLASLRAYLQGGEACIADFTGIEAYNDRSVAAREHLNFDQTYAEFEKIREELKAAIHELPDEKFIGSLLYPWKRRDTVTNLVEVLIEHEHEHADEIEKMNLNTTV